MYGGCELCYEKYFIGRETGCWKGLVRGNHDYNVWRYSKCKCLVSLSALYLMRTFLALSMCCYCHASAKQLFLLLTYA